jgi:endonuclease III
VNSELSHLSQEVYQRLLSTFGRPIWREPLPPLDELVSTILSQNTNDQNRDVAFNNLKRMFPQWEDVRDAKPGEVIDAIRFAGLANQKGPRIQEILRQITEERGTLGLGFLNDLQDHEAHAWLVRFKGVGPKTAAIVMQFSLGKPAFPVDTHIYRVSGRLGLRPENMTVEDAHKHLSSLFTPEEYGPAHLNLIRLGREVCKARQPLCQICPLNDICQYNKKQGSLKM